MFIHTQEKTPVTNQDLESHIMKYVNMRQGQTYFIYQLIKLCLKGLFPIKEGSHRQIFSNSTVTFFSY